MRRLIVSMCLLGLIGLISGENYLINGGQESKIQYQLIQRVEPAGDTKTLKMSFVVPESFQSPTYNQRIENFALNLTPEPSKKQDERDKRGNRIVLAEWKNPNQSVDVSMTFIAYNQTILKTLESSAGFPLTNLPNDVKEYLSATDQVQRNDPRIQEKAKELVRGVKTEFDAVQRILTWVVDHMRYVTPPEQYDALYAFENGKGNCQNYSHLTAALLRAVGIPVRIINGVTLKQPYTVRTNEGDFTFKMGQGRHSWIEVFFTDLGWIPFDPQQSVLFVSNRFVRIEVGVDNEETVNDGMVRWQQAKGVKGRPSFQEIIEAEFPVDNVQLSIARQNYGPQKMLLCPDVRAAFKKEASPPPPPPVEISDDKLKQLKYDKPFLFGNLDFPVGVDFVFARGPAKKGAEDEYEMRKNFMVETAEYVTTKLTQYAQIVVLKKPVKLVKVGLALHKFGGSGQLWIDLMKDEGGKPGNVLAASDWKMLDELSAKPGYDWVDFEFTKESPVLSPGKYWIGLGFTGSPIVNWFYTYGKPVGPVNGTRYKGVYESDWSGALAYEFNYRVAGWTSR
ncbi:MAG: transglutaminase-like domain-containing protein [bacterium]